MDVFQIHLMSAFLLFPGAHRVHYPVASELQSSRKHQGLERPEEGISFEGKASREIKWKGTEQRRQHARAGRY